MTRKDVIIQIMSRKAGRSAEWARQTLEGSISERHAATIGMHEELTEAEAATYRSHLEAGDNLSRLMETCALRYRPVTVV